MIRPQYLSRGFTLFEIIVYVGLFLLLAGTLVILINPPEIEQRLNDSRRMADLGILSQAITAYKIDNKTLPDDGVMPNGKIKKDKPNKKTPSGTDITSPVFRQSNVLPSGQTNLNSAVSGWIITDLSKYIQKLPVDPINDSTYFYRYTHNESSFEIDCRLQLLSDKASGDGGNDVNRYEVGTDLTLL